MPQEAIDPALALLRVGGLGGFLAAFAFLALWEGGEPLETAAHHRLRHAARNAGVFAAAVVLVYAVFRGPLLGDPLAALALPGAARPLLAPLALPAVALGAIGFVVADFAEYAFHRLSHHWRWLWLIHSVHHSDAEVDVTTGLRFHPLQTALETLVALATFAALGIPLWVLAARALVLNPYNLFQHANVAYPDWIEHRLRWLLVTPALHRLHHSPDAVETNSNYGGFLSVWDRWFGTLRLPDPLRRPGYGLRALAAEPWQTVRGMLATPFAARRIMVF